VPKKGDVHVVKGEKSGWDVKVEVHLMDEGLGSADFLDADVEQAPAEAR
jgi:hypothetical protein